MYHQVFLGTVVRLHPVTAADRRPSRRLCLLPLDPSNPPRPIKANAQTRLNITEIALPAASSAPAAGPAAGAADAEPAEEKPKEKTIFTVKLEKIDAANKAKIIREVKVLQPSMTLVEVSLRLCL